MYKSLDAYAVRIEVWAHRRPRLDAGTFARRGEGASARARLRHRARRYRRRHPGSRGEISGASLHTPRTADTDHQGRYDFPDLAPGRYTIHAAASGFEPRTADLVVASAPTSHDIVLGVSSYLERVSVTATRTGATDVQQTPIAITALSERTLQTLGIDRVPGFPASCPR